MAFELREGKGTLHRVMDKEGVDSRPDYEGKLHLDGKIYRLAGWINVSKNGDKWLSLNCELPRPKAALEKPPAKPAIDPGEDLPF